MDRIARVSDSSVYRRPLPEHQIAFSSAEGRLLFREALAAGTMEGYFPLAEQFHTQAAPALCGLGTLVVVLNALAIDPGRAWRGPWRWYSEEMLDCCRPLDQVMKEGVTMPDLVCLARCNGARATLHQADRASLDALREDVRAACSTPGEPHLVAAYSRGVLGQTGEGHYSPVGGYHPGRDLVLLLDVARFKYPPHWVPLGLLWEAMQPHDPVTSRPRGYVMLARGEAPPGSFCRVAPDASAWRGVAAELRASLPAAIAARRPASVEAAVAAFFGELSPRVAAAIAERAAPAGDPAALPPSTQEALAAIRETPLFPLIREALDAAGPQSAAAGAGLDPLRAHGAELATVLLMACPASVFSGVPAEVAGALDALRSPDDLPPRLAAEVAAVRAQMAALEDAGAGRI
ncbi:MAG: phytochelatin synthase [Polyangiaceae bacterium]|nr:phytochelatin synthase [Polyangiaceae bacterium]